MTAQNNDSVNQRFCQEAELLDAIRHLIYHAEHLRC